MLKNLFNRRVVLALTWVLTIALVAVVINLIGIRLIGSVGGWTGWLASHRWSLMAWRMYLYAATGYAWWWMRQRVRRREPSPETHSRLLRTEIAAVMVIAALETAALLTSP